MLADGFCFFFHQPDPDKASRDEAAEREILNKVKDRMTEEDLAELARATQELRLKQETPDPPEALRSVPSLSLQDIPKQPIQVPIEVSKIDLLTFGYSNLLISILVSQVLLISFKPHATLATRYNHFQSLCQCTVHV